MATHSAPKSRIRKRACGSRRTNESDAPESSSPSSRASSPPAPMPRSGSTSSAPPRQATPTMAKTIASEPTASTRPVRAGATKMLALSIQPEMTLVAVSSSGVRARLGAKADCVGRVMVNATVGPTSSAYTTSLGASAKSATATSAHVTALRDVRRDERRAERDVPAQRRHGRCEGRGGNQHDGRNDPALGHPALGVGVDEHRDPARILAAVVRDEGGLQAPQAAVAGEGPEHVPHRRDRMHRAIISGGCTHDPMRCLDTPEAGVLDSARGVGAG